MYDFIEIQYYLALKTKIYYSFNYEIVKSKEMILLIGGLEKEY